MLTQIFMLLFDLVGEFFPAAIFLLIGTGVIPLKKDPEQSRALLHRFRVWVWGGFVIFLLIGSLQALGSVLHTLSLLSR